MTAKFLRGFIPFTVSTGLFFVLWGLKITDATFSLIFAFLLEIVLLCHIALQRVDAVHASLGDIAAVRGLAEVPTHIRNATRLESRFNPAIADCLVRDFANQVGQMGRGLQRLSPDRFMLVAATIYGRLREGDTLIATSYFAGGDYWKERYGKEYMQLNRDAHARGARIERIFVLRDEGHRAEKLPILKSQSEFVSVYTCMLDNQALNEEEHRDFFVINDDMAAEFHFSPNQVLLGVDLITDKLDVQRLKTIILRIRNTAATPFKSNE
ncbi:hypothetical protein ACG02S_18135 [Roseateles sp. DC23W]|uniref:Uncharacterized protein n=1 Tax=Pelomonas dachongensis TaxID=3299029 RepID=A0ABW7ET19_9BURK